MPYGYYQLVRFITLIGFSFLAYQLREKDAQKEFIIYIVLAILFQPFFKIALGRVLWNIVDVIVAIGLIVSIFVKPEQQDKKNILQVHRKE
ncbi:MAG: hypothetical protein EOO43_05430 [Flavobacterium sp.]|nr:MAG: hypothetical protein EOO43_05430 [Flavobacterium sp.]